jgi:hypothetical protein
MTNPPSLSLFSRPSAAATTQPSCAESGGTPKPAITRASCKTQGRKIENKSGGSCSKEQGLSYGKVLSPNKTDSRANP